MKVIKIENVKMVKCIDSDFATDITNGKIYKVESVDEEEYQKDYAIIDDSGECKWHSGYRFKEINIFEYALIKIKELININK